MMLKRFFAELEILEQRRNFNIYKIPNHVKKEPYMKSDQWTQNPVPVCVAKQPYVFKNPQLGTKKYYWCSCGLSKKQPFCDSTHMKTAFKPVPFVIQEKVSEVSLCLCKHTSSAPFCDGKACKS
ncbi:unnamed protein product [Blepharisma stoltei]|uniref:Iron-binding zinc finger CDGSH type domain-containing protein n=1 Tax=Blepharisma stoltei TaxID=1481888 RepID=A0AAU9JEU3_9CILI|nr:unnamed protein product [Blepharisma stoltei]